MTPTKWAALSTALGQAVSKVCIALVLFGAVHWSGDQIAGLVAGVESITAIPLVWLGATNLQTSRSRS